MSKYLKVSEFIQDIRDRLGDTSCEIPERFIISWLNLVLPRLAREPGLDKLFKFHDTYELASLKADGSKAAAWQLNDANMGDIIDMKKLRLLDTQGCEVSDATPCYVPIETFFDCNPLPESNQSGTPSTFSIDYIGGNTMIYFDRPIDGPYAVDLRYTAYHPRIKSVDDYIKLSTAFIDVLNEYVTIMYMQESSDFATARALYEDYDHLVDQVRELLARQHSTLPFRKLKGSF